MAFWFVVLFLIIQQIEGNLIYPRVVGETVGLPAIWVLAAVSVGEACSALPGCWCLYAGVHRLYAAAG